MACSFLLIKRWTSRRDGRALPTLARFLAVFVAAYIVNLVAVMMLIQIGANDYLAHSAGTPLYSIAFCLGCRHFVFPRYDSR